MYRVFFEGVISSSGPSGRCGPRDGNAPAKANRSRTQSDDVSIDILICYLAKWSDVGGGMTVSTRGRRKVYLARAGWTWNRGRGTIPAGRTRVRCDLRADPEGAEAGTRAMEFSLSTLFERER